MVRDGTATRSPDHYRKMEKTLQHQATPQCIGLPPTGSRNHRPDGIQANHALERVAAFRIQDFQFGRDVIPCL